MKKEKKNRNSKTQKRNYKRRVVRILFKCCGISFHAHCGRENAKGRGEEGAEV
jgi:hypothetical protein